MQLEAECPGNQYTPFGWIGIISFPFLWAPAFGEFGSRMWRRWAQRFREAGIHVRSCVVHHLDLTEGA
jgi:hypothetical protein